MAWKKGESGNPHGRPHGYQEFTEQLRIISREEVTCPEDKTKRIRRLRMLADVVWKKALAGEAWAIQHISERLDGKPAQETNVNVNDKRERTDWSDAELVALIHEARAGSKRDRAKGERSKGSDRVH